MGMCGRLCHSRHVKARRQLRGTKSLHNFTWGLDQTCGSYTPQTLLPAELLHWPTIDFSKSNSTIKSCSVNYSMKKNNTRLCFLVESTQFSFHGRNEGPEQHEILPSVAMTASHQAKSLGLYTMEEVLDPSVHRSLFWGSFRWWLILDTDLSFFTRARREPYLAILCATQC